MKVYLHISQTGVAECVTCGFSDQRALQIDHINGGGLKDLKKHGNQNQYLNSILALPKKEAEDKYQVLCANCNWIKRVEKEETNQHGGIN